MPIRKSKPMPKPKPAWPRALPYRPTPQKFGRYLSVKGNPPHGITDREWDLAYNNAHSTLYAAFGARKAAKGSEARNLANERLGAAMKTGVVRDKAMDILVKKGKLSKDYKDNDY